MKKYIFTKKFKCRFALLFSLLLIGQMSFAQEMSISGKITESAENSTVPGVIIKEKGTENGTISDFDGNFSITVSSANAVLLISSIGFENQEISVNGNSKIDVVMVAKTEAIDEVVIIGYGTLKKSDLTGSVGSLSDEMMTERSIPNPMEAMQGSVAGVTITNSTGRIGDEFSISIRGKNSMNEDSKPLYVVDGVPTDGIDFINPNDISRIDILKDASSTAIYGSRGSNGVIIVTTKSGSTAKKGINISIDSYYGVKKVARLPQMMDGERWWYYHQSAYLATTNLNNPMAITPELLASKVVGTKNSLLLERALAGETFDWYDAVLQDGATSNNYINISGNTENTAYNMGIGMQNEIGNIANEYLDKYTFKTSIFHKVNDKLTVGNNISIASTNQEQGSEYAMREAFRLSPLMTPYGLDGELFPLPGKLTDLNGVTVIDKTSTYNPLLEIANSSDNTKRWNVIGNAFAEYTPLNWLTLKSTFSAGYDSRKRGESWGVKTNNGVLYANQASAETTESSNFNYTWDNQFNIKYNFKEDHNFNFMGLQSIYATTTTGSSMISRNMPFETDFYNMGSGAQGSYAVGSYYTKQTLASFAMRLNYDYKGKYLLTLSNRWDGSSLLSEGNKWESFFSGALAWRITEEAFLANKAEWLSNLKLRLSYGYTGNNIIPTYSTMNKLDLQTYYEFNGTVASGWLPTSLANNLLTWEKTSEFNLGLDFGFLNNRIFGSVDAYDKLSDGLLMPQQLPKETGWGTINANIGSVSNKGIELTLTTLNIQKSKLSWETTFIFSKNKNEIISLYGQSENDDIGNEWFIGEDIDSEYDYEFYGIWQASEKDLAASYNQKEGQVRVVDQNNDGVISAIDDRIILGSSTPDWTGSFNTRLTYSNFDLSASVITSQGIFVYSEFHANFTDVTDRGRQKLDIDFYVPENGAGIAAQYTNDYPQPQNVGPYGRRTEFYRDASFVKVKNISLGYTFSKDMLNKIKISYLRVYFNVLDPFVFTQYEGYDPEWAGASYNIARVGSVTYQLGLNLKF